MDAILSFINVNTLAVAKWTNYVVDIIVILFLVGFAIVCAKKGFIECLFGFLSTIVALVTASVLAKVIVDATNGWFGVQNWLADLLTTAFGKISGFETVISEGSIESALLDKNLPVILANLALKYFGKGDVPDTMTLAQVFGGTTSRLICLLVTGALVFLIVKLLLLLQNHNRSKALDN